MTRKKKNKMIKKVFLTSFCVFSVTLNVLLFVDNQKLSARVRSEILERIHDKFERNHPYNERRVKPKYPIVT